MRKYWDILASVLWIFNLLQLGIAFDAKVVSIYGNKTGEDDVYKDLMNDAESFINNNQNRRILGQGDEIQVIHRKQTDSRVFDDVSLFQAIKIACDDVNNRDAIALILPNDLCPDCSDIGKSLANAYSPVLTLDQADDSPAFKMRPTLRDMEEMITGVIDNFKWTTFIMLYQGSSGRKLTQRMMAKHHLYNWTIAPVMVEDDLDKQMEDLRTRTIKNIVVYATDETILKPLFKTAFESGLLSTGWHWMFANLNPPITKAFLEQKYRHSMAWLTRFKVNRDGMTYHYHITNQDAIKKWPFRMRAAYDSLVAVGMALSEHKKRTQKMPDSVAQCGGDTRSTLEEDLRKISFVGASGVVSFNEKGDRVNYTVKIFSGKDKWAENEVGVYAQNPDWWARATGEPWPGKDGSRVYIKPFRQADSSYIKVLAVPEPPIFMQKNWETILYGDIRNDERDEDGEKYQGMAYELLKEIKIVMEEELGLDFEYQIHLFSRGQYGNIDLATGEWDGMVKDLEDGDADIGIGAFVKNSARESAIDFTESWYTGDIKLLMLHPSWSFEYPFALIFPYHWDAWCGLGVCVCLATCVVAALAYLSPYEYRKRALRGEASAEEAETFTFYNSIFYVISTGFWMGFQRGPKSWSIRVFSLFWFLFALSIVWLYGSMLKGVFDFSKTAINVKDEHDLLYQDQFEFGVVKYSPAYDYFRYNDNYYPKMIWDRMMTSDDEDLMFYKIDKAAYRIRRQWDARYTILGEEQILKTAGDRKPCRLFVTGHSLGEVKFGLGVTSGSPLRDQLSYVILRLKERGVIDRIKNKQYSKDLRCQNDSIWETQSKDSITSHDMQGPYYMLAIGIASSFVIFVMEVVVFNFTAMNNWRTRYSRTAGGNQTNIRGAGDEFGDFYSGGGGKDSAAKGPSAPPISNKSTDWI